MDTGIEGKSVLITEAVGNYGRATVMAFAEEGANLLLTTFSSQSQLEEVAHQASTLGVRVETRLSYAGDEAGAQALAQQGIAEFGHLDILVNNVVYPLSTESLEKISFKEWKRKIEVEVTGSFFICRAVLPGMIQQQWGRVISYTGLAAFLGTEAPSSATEYGIVGLTRGIAREYGKYNITANCIGPGGVEAGDDLGFIPSTPSDSDPIPRWGKPEEVTFLTIWLASEGAGYVTGQSLLVNGGKHFL